MRIPNRVFGEMESNVAIYLGTENKDRILTINDVQRASCTHLQPFGSKTTVQLR